MTTMHAVHIAGLDLNLIVALDALLKERNVTRAAAQIGITQSAMSHALARLRVLTGDALLVRTSRGMTATARAEALGPPIRRALDEVQRALSPVPAFDPKTATGRVKIGTSDYGELVLLPKVVARMEKEAPGLDVRVRNVDEANLVGQLALGEIDLALLPPRPEIEAPGMYAKHLFDENFVCVVRKSHPLAKKKLTVARFAAASHALISPRGLEGGIADDALAKLGLQRRVAVVVPHFLVAPYVVATSDLLLTLARRVADVVAGPLGLAVLAPPSDLALAGFTMLSVWHARTHGDPAQRWMRNLFAEVAKTI